MMRRVAVSACCAVVVSTAARPAHGQAGAILETLTVPPAGRPADCVPIPSDAERDDSGRVHTGLWNGFRIPSNPWTGTSWRVLTQLRHTILGPTRTPDALPDARLNAKMNRDVVEGHEGYVALYRHGADRVAVYGLRSPDPQPWTPASASDVQDSAGRAVVRLGHGGATVMVVGERGDCFTAVERHVRAAVAAMPTVVKAAAPK